ncbi:GNAT family N-acetyltransferase [Shewanella sp. SNU WT4]|uniref:GNAT family N-acetyltransferase n=1 Tax=Shewanella sp. SNU WT4 TaxID=2590015 RepID=UPI00112CF8FE|nr:GNAT family N-acetyltransferase [Shewanella sp. SNU WT4]QDF68005.1 GNAT family N-acetyltransferase [Shewanella sp. SNU WT4]
MYQLRIANLSDLDILCQLESCHARQESRGHWQSEALPRQLLSLLLEKHLVVFATEESKTIAYGIAADWQTMVSMPLYKKGFDLVKQQQKAAPWCHWGPVWVSPSERGHGLCGQLFAFALTHLEQQYRSIQAIVAEDNEASFQAHSREGMMTVASYFSSQGQDYYLLNRDI